MSSPEEAPTTEEPKTIEGELAPEQVEQLEVEARYEVKSLLNRIRGHFYKIKEIEEAVPNLDLEPEEAAEIDTLKTVMPEAVAEIDTLETVPPEETAKGDTPDKTKEPKKSPRVEMLNLENIIDLKWKLDKAIQKELKDRQSPVESLRDKGGYRAAALRKEIQKRLIDEYIQTGVTEPQSKFLHPNYYESKNSSQKVEERKISDAERNKIESLLDLSYDKLEEAIEKRQQPADQAKYRAPEAGAIPHSPVEPEVTTDTGETPSFNSVGPEVGATPYGPVEPEITDTVVGETLPSSPISAAGLEAYVNEQLLGIAEAKLDQEIGDDSIGDFRRSFRAIWRAGIVKKQYEQAYREEARKYLQETGGDISAVRKKLLAESEETVREINKQALRAAIEQTLDEKKDLYPFIQSQPELWVSIKKTVIKCAIGDIGGLEFNNQIKEAIENANIHDKETLKAIIEDVDHLLETALSTRDYIEAGIRNEAVLAVIAQVEAQGASEHGNPDTKTRRELLEKTMRFFGDHFPPFPS